MDDTRSNLTTFMNHLFADYVGTDTYEAALVIVFDEIQNNAAFMASVTSRERFTSEPALLTLVVAVAVVLLALSTQHYDIANISSATETMLAGPIQPYTYTYTMKSYIRQRVFDLGLPLSFRLLLQPILEPAFMLLLETTTTYQAQLRRVQ